MRNKLVLASMLLCTVAPAVAEVSVAIRSPTVSIGINLPLYPELVPVPGYPVYYAPDVGSNYFFYDGVYWVYQDDNWYASSWYNGPWDLVEPEFVPLFVLRVPVQYYRRPPVYFRSWGQAEPPHWGEHWGNEWSRHRSGWDHWDRHAVPAPAPLPVYQRQYSADRYPQAERQAALKSQNYRYQPHDAVARQVYQRQQDHNAPAPTRPEAQHTPPPRNPAQNRPAPNRVEGSDRQPRVQQQTPSVPRPRPSQAEKETAPRPMPAQVPTQRPVVPPHQPEPRAEQRQQHRNQPAPPEPKPEQNRPQRQGQKNDRDTAGDHGEDHRK